MKAGLAVLATTALLTSGSMVLDASAAPPVTHGTAGPGSFGANVQITKSQAEPDSTTGESSAPTVEVINCGPVTVGGGVVHEAGDCTRLRDTCAVATAADIPTYPAVNEIVVLTYPDGHQETQTRCAVRDARATPPQVSGEMAREAAQRALPNPSIGTAPVGHTTLVNIDTILWIDTPRDITLPTATLLKQRVGLRAHLESADWTFGDTHTGHTDGPGREYTDTDPCTTATCPDYFAHTYTATGDETITAHLTWTGQFRVGTGPWQNIPRTVTDDATPDTITVDQARGVLVPNP